MAIYVSGPSAWPQAVALTYINRLPFYSCCGQWEVTLRVLPHTGHGEGLSFRFLPPENGTLARKKVDSVIMPAAVAIANGNPIGLIAVGGREVYGKANGTNKLEGRINAIADPVAVELRLRFQHRGWIN